MKLYERNLFNKIKKRIKLLFSNWRGYSVYKYLIIYDIEDIGGDKGYEFFIKKEDLIEFTNNIIEQNGVLSVCYAGKIKFCYDFILK
jgi:hypothetical protein